MNSKIGMFSILTLGVMMLLIPATSIANTQEYDGYYEEEKERYYGDDYSYENERYYDDYRQDNYDEKSYYEEPYKKEDKKDKPVIIVKNEPIPQKEKKKMKEPPMVLVNKELLFCDLIANGTDDFCLLQQPGIPTFPAPDSDRYVENCTNKQCEDIDIDSYEFTLLPQVDFNISEEGTKLNLVDERYTVAEKIVFEDSSFSVFCNASGFDTAVFTPIENGVLAWSCVLFEGDCSGFVQDGELKECTVKNYVVNVEFDD